MAQPVLLAALYVLGVACALAIGPRRDPLLCSAIAFPLGLAVAVFGALALIFVGAPVTREVAVAAWGTLTALALAIAGRRGGAVDVRLLAAGAAVFAVVVAIGASWGPGALDRESPRVVAIARFAAADDLVLDVLWRRLSRIGMFPVLSRALIGDVGTALAASTLALAAVTAWRTRAPLLITLLLAASLGLTALIARPLFGATHVAAATYLFAFAALWTSGLTTSDRVVPPALIALAALSLATPLAPFLATPALALAFLAGRPLRSAALLPTTVLATALLAWWSLPATTVPSPGLVIGGMEVYAAALGLAYLVSREVDEGVLAPVGGRERAIGLVFAVVVGAMVAGNVRAMAANQRVLPERWRITVHDTFDVERATRDLRARSVELLERE